MISRKRFWLSGFWLFLLLAGCGGEADQRQGSTYVMPSPATVLLTDMEGRHTDLQAVLDGERGRLVYVDLWASWCLPCRASMPASAKLRKLYEPQGVTFVYLGYNDRPTNWRSAGAELGLAGLPHHYFILNPYRSELLEELQIETIPRYLLFDQEGRLVHRSPPGPVKDELRVLFKQYLGSR